MRSFVERKTNCVASNLIVFILIFVSQVYDILVVNQNYNGDGSANSLSLRRGDLVEVLDQKPINHGTAADKDPSAK